MKNIVFRWMYKFCIFFFIAVIRAAIVRHLRTTQTFWLTSIQTYRLLELTMIRQAWVSTCQRAFYSWSLCSSWSSCRRLTFGATWVRLTCPDGMTGAWTTNCTLVWWYFSLVTCWKLRYVFKKKNNMQNIIVCWGKININW